MKAHNFLKRTVFCTRRYEFKTNSTFYFDICTLCLINFECVRVWLISVDKKARKRCLSSRTFVENYNQTNTCTNIKEDFARTIGKRACVCTYQWYSLEYVVRSVCGETLHGPQTVRCHVYTKFEVLCSIACNGPCSAVTGHPSSGERESACQICNME